MNIVRLLWFIQYWLIFQYSRIFGKILFTDQIKKKKKKFCNRETTFMTQIESAPPALSWFLSTFLNKYIYGSFMGSIEWLIGCQIVWDTTTRCHLTLCNLSVHYCVCATEFAEMHNCMKKIEWIRSSLISIAVAETIKCSDHWVNEINSCSVIFFFACIHISIHKEEKSSRHPIFKFNGALTFSKVLLKTSSQKLFSRRRGEFKYIPILVKHFIHLTRLFKLRISSALISFILVYPNYFKQRNLYRLKHQKHSCTFPLLLYM